MKQFNAKIYEEWGYKASRKGFFKEWQEMTSSISRTENLPRDEAAEVAYKTLKLQGSE